MTAHTKKNSGFAAEVLEGAEEAVDIARGHRKSPRVTRRSMARMRTTIDAAPGYDAEAVRRIRDALGMSQSVFAAGLNVSEATVRARSLQAA